jgi:hypothetical protein
MRLKSVHSHLSPRILQFSRARGIGLRFGNDSDEIEPWPDQWEEGEDHE